MLMHCIVCASSRSHGRCKLMSSKSDQHSENCRFDGIFLFLRCTFTSKKASGSFSTFFVVNFATLDLNVDHVFGPAAECSAMTADHCCSAIPDRHFPNSSHRLSDGACCDCHKPAALAQVSNCVRVARRHVGSSSLVPLHCFVECFDFFSGTFCCAGVVAVFVVTVLERSASSCHCDRRSGIGISDSSTVCCMGMMKLFLPVGL